MDHQSSEPRSQLPLPEKLEEEFITLRGELRKEVAREWGVCALVALILFFLIFTLFDRLVLVTSVGRVLALFLGLSGLFVIGPLRFFSRAFKYQSYASLSRLIKRQMPRFGDRLQGAIELRTQDLEAMHTSSALSEAALNQIAAQAREVDFSRALPKCYTKLLAFCLGGVVLVSLVLFTLYPKHLSNTLSRYLLPFSEISRYTVVKFSDVPERLYIPKGESSSQIVYLENSEQLDIVPSLIAKISGESPQAVRYLEGYHIDFPELSEPKKLSLQAGDAFLEVALVPAVRPRIKGIEAEIQWPEYLGRPEERQAVSTQVVDVLKGAKIAFNFEMNSKLESVESKPSQSFMVDGELAKTRFLKASEMNELSLSFRDENGLESLTPYHLQFKVVEDGAPTARIKAQAKELILLAHETHDFNLSGKDDYGISAMNVLWHPLKDKEDVQRIKVRDGGVGLTQASVSYAFNPKVLDIVPDTYLVYAEVKDYFPDRGGIRSKPIMVHILTPEAHAQYLRQRLTALLDDLDEIYLRELTSYYENLRVLEGSAVDAKFQSHLQSASTIETKQIKDLKGSYKESSAILADSFRNTQLQRSLKRSLAILTQQVNVLGAEILPGIKAYLVAAQDNQFSQEYSLDQLSGAIAAQKEALAYFKDMIEKGREVDRVFESSTFVHRLHELARKQSQLTQDLWTAYGGVIGNTPRELDPRLRHENISFRDEQMDIYEILQWIEDDLKNYSDLSKNESYQDLAETISESNVYEGLLNIANLIEVNHRYPAMRAANDWKKQMDMWAKLLSGKVSESRTNGSGGGGGASATQDQDAEFMLRVMEIIRSQQDLRGETRAIQQNKELLK